MNPPAGLQVTVSGGVDPGRVREARRCAAAWGLPYVDRPKKTALSALAAAGPFLVLGADGWTYREGADALRFTPGMAAVRIKRLEAGRDEDTLVRLARLSAGDEVLDCTFGLGGDALVCARAVGPTGRVVGVEKSFVLSALATRALEAGLGFKAMAPIALRHADHLEVLQSLGPASFDVVLFDPMFTRPQRGSPTFELIRRHADPSPLSEQALTLARRVARRCVLVKGAKYSKDLKALGLVPELGGRFSNLVWAKVGPISSG